MGVSVSDTKAETRMVTASVMANSRKSLPDDIAHEQQRNQHRDQRDRQRQNRESDLRRTFQRRLQRRFAFLDVAGDVFNHDDGIVHHETGTDGERHQGEVVEAVAQQVHHPKRAHDGKRHGEAGNDGGAHAAKESRYGGSKSVISRKRGERMQAMLLGREPRPAKTPLGASQPRPRCRSHSR